MFMNSAVLDLHWVLWCHFIVEGVLWKVVIFRFGSIFISDTILSLKGVSSCEGWIELSICSFGGWLMLRHDEVGGLLAISKMLR
jgi:hypothetical protein